MNEPKAFQWCFIGAGGLANTVAKSILPSGRHRITSVYTRRLEKGQAFAKKYHATAYESAKEAISAPGVDAVYIVTPHNSHYDYARLALSLGKPVLCEKPFTITAKETQELFAYAAEQKLYLTEAMWTWFAPAANRVKTWLDNGEFGTIESLDISYHTDLRGRGGRWTSPNQAGGALLDIGVYPITYLYRLFGYPVRTECAGTLEAGIDMCEDVTMTFENGLTCTATISMKDFKGLERLRINGSAAKVDIPFYHAANGAKLVRKHGKNEKVKGSGWYLNEFDLVSVEIREGLTQSRLVPPSATLDVMRIMDDCRRQLNLIYPFEE